MVSGMWVVEMLYMEKSGWRPQENHCGCLCNDRLEQQFGDD